VTGGARIALLRGVNVGGHNKLPMAKLREVMTAAGFGDVATYIQSGNIVYRPCGSSSVADDADALSALIGEHFGFRPAAIVLEASDLAAHLAASPYADVDASRAFCVFVDGDPSALGDLAPWATDGEEWTVLDGVVHLHCPNGLGTSKLGERLHAKRAGVTTTARNLRTIAKVVELAGGL